MEKLNKVAEFLGEQIDKLKTTIEPMPEMPKLNTIDECLFWIGKGEFENVAGELKNHKAFIILKELLSKNCGEITEKSMENYFRKMKVESGWLYNFWSVEKQDYEKEWVFVPSA